MSLRSRPNGAYGERRFRRVVSRPFPLMGKGRDRGASNRPNITPTLFLPRQGEGNKTLPTVGRLYK